MKPARLKILALAAAAAAVVAAAIVPRVLAAAALAARAEASAHTIVNVVIAAPKATATVFTLPASIQAFQDTPIYARTTGFIAKWTTDIGDRVKAGQVMAVIDAPDLDQELNQARAALEQAKANLEIARISADRWRDLGTQNAVAQQDVDQKAADFAGAKAAVVAAQANVERLAQLKDFQQVTAPYDGVVTARNVQVGQLITANLSTGIELFHIAETDVLRVFVDVPQAYVRSVREGLAVDITVPEFPGRAFTGAVARYAGALDSASRTLLVEIHLPNPKGELFAGMFGQARFSIPPTQSTIILPSNAAIFNAAGTQVAVVDDSNHIRLLQVKFGRDFGTQIEIIEGLKAGAHVVANPSDALTDGLEVSPVLQQEAPKK